MSVEPDGVLMASYSNGQSRPAGQLQLATFRNPQGLVAMGGNVWANSFASGTPVTGRAGDGASACCSRGPSKRATST